LGLAPNLVGLYQVNAEIPADVPLDGTTPIILEMESVLAHNTVHLMILID